MIRVGLNRHSFDGIALEAERTELMSLGVERLGEAMEWPRMICRIGKGKARKRCGKVENSNELA